VTSAPLFGRPEYAGKLLPAGRDPLSQALGDTFPGWTIGRLTEAACAVALATDDFSLVGLAARVQDVVVLTAVRESVVLYAEAVAGAGPMDPPEYVWNVDEDLVRQAKRFIEAFKNIFGDALPEPESKNAALYWSGYRANDIVGRCVRIGFDNTASPVRHYHWAICFGRDGKYIVQEFWKPEVWTTARYRAIVREEGGCPKL
jgi:hypothetical protein